MDCFVLVTANYFGVFDIAASDYPSILLENMSDVKCVNRSDLDEYLLEKVGRNCLIRSGFNRYTGIGQVYRK